MSPYLTKSRFKKAAECATKLYYGEHPEYFNAAVDDSFLQALIEGGFQVGALACLQEAGGIEITAHGADQQVADTLALLQREEVVIYEATLRFGRLLVRVDILRKQGRRIDLIEVKAKIYDRERDGNFVGKKGQIGAAWLPYVQDIAFQHHVATQAFPGHDIHPWLMLADKSARATVDGLNQAIRIRRDGPRARVDLAPGIAERLGAPLLVKVPAGEAVAVVQGGTLTVAGESLPFVDAIARLDAALRDGERLQGQPGPHCRDCEFNLGHWPALDEPRSGFHECWSRAFGWQAQDFAEPNVLQLWNHRSKDKLIAQGVLKLKQVQQEDLKLDDEEPGIEGLSTALRQWFQCTREDPWVDEAGLARDMATWRYPLNFIDFETAVVPIPFTAGRKPYEVIAFQFSHHLMHEDGRVEHANQFLDTRLGVDPCREFLDALRAALLANEGTVFRWSHHENSVLNQLRERLLEAPQEGDDERIAFIELITHAKDRDPGERDMVDLCALASRYYFHPSTKGSNSLKKVLPALMRSSAILKERYGVPRYGGTEMPSLNLREPMVWWMPDAKGDPRDPYELLPPVFDDFSQVEIDALQVDEAEGLQDGGAALTAYARLQAEDMRPEVKAAIEQALLRYCELDTFAMAMVVEAWKSDFISIRSQL